MDNPNKPKLAVGTICRVLADADRILAPNSIVVIVGWCHTPGNLAAQVEEIMAFPGPDYENARKGAKQAEVPIRPLFWEGELEPWGDPSTEPE